MFSAFRKRLQKTCSHETQDKGIVQRLKVYFFFFPLCIYKENMHNLINIQPILFFFFAICTQYNKDYLCIIIYLPKLDDLK